MSLLGLWRRRICFENSIGFLVWLQGYRNFSSMNNTTSYWLPLAIWRWLQLSIHFSAIHAQGYFILSLHDQVTRKTKDHRSS